MGTSDGSVLGTTKIVDNGPATQRWNLVILSEGYRSTEMAQFAEDAKVFTSILFVTPPFDRLWFAINVYRVDVTSTDSGAKDPIACGGSGATPRTYFDASFCGDGVLQRLLVANNATVLSVAGAQVPQWHMVLLAVNSTIYGGSGGAVGTFSKAAGSNLIALHEMGHTAFGLADEYESYVGCGHPDDIGHESFPPGEPIQPNITTDVNRATIKWRSLIQATTRLPTTANKNCAVCDPQLSPVPAGTIGAFEGAYHYHCGCYRPAFDCRMRTHSFPFCAVCQQVISSKLAPFLPPVFHWSSLRGTALDPLVASNLDGRLEVFARGNDNALWHIWQLVPNGGWSGWASLGGGIVGRPAVGRNADGRLEVFVRGTDNALHHMWQVAPNSGWSKWQSLGGGLTGAPAVARNADGRLEVFVRGTDIALHHMWQVAPNGGWSSWQGLGAILKSDPVVERNADGRLEVFVRGTDNALHHTWQVAPNSGWSGWAGLGGGLAGAPVVGSNEDGGLEVFVRATDNALHHMWQVAPNSGWSNWQGLGGVLTSDPAVSRNADGRLEVFARGPDTALKHMWQVAPNSGWSGWSDLGGGFIGAPLLGRNADGRLEVFVTGTDNALWHIWQTAANNGWV
jgi:acylphosphatase